MDHKVRTCLWFSAKALEAARFYVSLLPDSKIEDEASLENMVTGEEDGVQFVEFTLAGTPYKAMNAGPHHEFNDAMSIVVMTEDQAETDRLWNAITSDGGKPVQCGWATDRFGVRWQIVPRRMTQLLARGEREGISRMFKAMMPMQKLDIATLEAAYFGEEG